MRQQLSKADFLKKFFSLKRKCLKVVTSYMARRKFDFRI